MTLGHQVGLDRNRTCTLPLRYSCIVLLTGVYERFLESLQHFLLVFLGVVGGQVAEHLIPEHAHSAVPAPLRQLERALRVLLVPKTK